MVARRKSASKLFSSARLALACNRAPPAPGCGSALQRSVRAGLRLKTARTPAVGRWFNQASPRRRPAAGATGGGQRDLVGRPRSAGRRDPPEVERGRGHGVGAERFAASRRRRRRDAGRPIRRPLHRRAQKGPSPPRSPPPPSWQMGLPRRLPAPFPARQRSSRRVTSNRTRTPAAASSAVMAAAGLWLMPFLQRKKSAPAGQRGP